MIQWLLRLIGIEPAIGKDRRKSLIARLQEPVEKNGASGAAQTLERHAKREEAIASHKAEVAEEVTRCKRERKQHQSDLHESTILIDKAHKKATTRRRRNPTENPFNVAEFARQEARRRRDRSG